MSPTEHLLQTWDVLKTLSDVLPKQWQSLGLCKKACGICGPVPGGILGKSRFARYKYTKRPKASVLCFPKSKKKLYKGPLKKYFKAAGLGRWNSWTPDVQFRQ